MYKCQVMWVLNPEVCVATYNLGTIDLGVEGMGKFASGLINKLEWVKNGEKRHPFSC